MIIRELQIPGAWEIRPQLHHDSRGHFHEAFTADAFREMTGHSFDLKQLNISVSGEGVVRGLHFAETPPGQAKYVFCPAGTVFDVIVDIRFGSPTFGEWAGLILDSTEHHAVYLSEGLAHGFLSMEPGSTVAYLCSEPWRPGAEHAIDAFDPRIGIDWPSVAVDGSVLDFERSEKDAAAPTLADVAAQGVLPKYEDCQAYVESLRERM